MLQVRLSAEVEDGPLQKDDGGVRSAKKHVEDGAPEVDQASLGIENTVATVAVPLHHGQVPVNVVAVGIGHTQGDLVVKVLVDWSHDVIDVVLDTQPLAQIEEESGAAFMK